MKELVVISGKGGTGKTSIVASFAALAENAVLADCDVDAADLHLVLTPTIRRREEFRCGHEAIIRQADCIGCGACLARCRFGAVLRIDGTEGDLLTGAKTTCDNCTDGCKRSCPVKFADIIEAMQAAGGEQNEHAFVIDSRACEGCGVCVWSCPVKAIDFPERVSGEWYVSDTRHGPMVHARLIPGGENSGRLVSMVREAAQALAGEHNSELILVDGPPGVGCAVIASVSGASQVLIVTEPTLSGVHDMARVLELTRHFNIPAAVCVNKWDLNAEMTERIESEARQAGASVAGRVRYDRAVTEAQIHGKAVVELRGALGGDDMRAVWEKISGDEPLSVCQLASPVDGAVIVTTPQDVATANVRKSINFCRQLSLPVLGVVENMSGFVCPRCGEVANIFAAGGGKRMATEMGVPFLGPIPIDPAVGQACDAGTPFVYRYNRTETAKAFERVIGPILALSNNGTTEQDTTNNREGISMRIAIPVVDGKLCMHFGHCDQFALVDADENTKKVTGKRMVTPPPHEPGVLPRWLHQQEGANVIIAGGMGQRAQSLFAENGINVVVGASSESPEQLVAQYLAGTLVSGENVCDH